MPLALLLDENVRGPLWHAIRRHNLLNPDWALDVVRVGDLAELPLGLDDRSILSWCEVNKRFLISHDLETKPQHFQSFLDAGHTCPGLFLIRKGFSLRRILEQLVLLAYAGEPEEFVNRLFYLPL